MNAEEIWRAKGDAEVLDAARELETYTEEGRRIIQAEMARRGMLIASASAAGTVLMEDRQPGIDGPPPQAWRKIASAVGVILILIAAALAGGVGREVGRVFVSGRPQSAAPALTPVASELNRNLSDDG